MLYLESRELRSAAPFGSVMYSMMPLSALVFLNEFTRTSLRNIGSAR